jgi:hypothetical protein
MLITKTSKNLNVTYCYSAKLNAPVVELISESVREDMQYFRPHKPDPETEFLSRNGRYIN